MLAEARDVPAGKRLEADLCIVGAGAAGIAMARGLSGRGLRIVLLEGGGEQLEAATQTLYQGKNTGLPYFPLESSRLRYLGGTTGHWGGACRPLDPIDFERREGIPRSGWPISRSDLDPFYPEAAEIVGLDDDEDWKLATWEDRDEFEPLELGEGLRTRVARLVKQDARRFGTRYRAELAGARDIALYLHANVTELETDADGRRVERVHVATLGGHRFTVAARAFVLATGAIENARLLLASDRHRPRGVGNDHDVVGRYFLEHPRFVGAVLAPSSSELETRFYEPHHVAGNTIEGYLALSDAMQREHRLLDVQLKLRAVYDGAYENIEDDKAVASLRSLGGKPRKSDPTATLGSHVLTVARDLTTWHHFTVPGAPLPLPYPEVIKHVARAAPAERRALLPGLLGEAAGYAYTKLLGSAPVARVEISTRIGPVPNPDSRVTLGRERDALGMRRVELDWQLSRLDRESVVSTLRLLGAAVGAAGLGRLRVVIGEDGDWPSDLAGGWHQMGTTRMSDDPRHGVVDGQCQVHGVSNLFIAGSSVFPTAGSGTPTMTLVALALRLARHLGEELT
jgi:choline dehydrogenase-like flavoprotein